MNLLSVQGPSEIILQFTNMIQYQISNYTQYGLTNTHPIMDLWAKVVCAIWKESESDLFVYVLDTIFRNVFQSQSLQWARELLINLITVSIFYKKPQQKINCYLFVSNLVVPKKM